MKPCDPTRMSFRTVSVVVPGHCIIEPIVRRVRLSTRLHRVPCALHVSANVGGLCGACQPGAVFCGVVGARSPQGHPHRARLHPSRPAAMRGSDRDHVRERGQHGRDNAGAEAVVCHAPVALAATLGPARLQYRLFFGRNCPVSTRETTVAVFDAPRAGRDRAQLSTLAANSSAL